MVDMDTNQYTNKGADMPAIEVQCSSCPQVGPRHLVQPQEDGSNRCTECHNKAVEIANADRKAALAARPKCTCCNKRRGTWKVAGVLMCGYCKSRVERNRHAETKGTPAWMLLGMAPIEADDVRRLALT